VTLGGEITPPFLVRGIPVTRLWADLRNDAALPALEAAVDQNTMRRPVRETVAKLEELDNQILAHVRGSRPRGTRPSLSVVDGAADPPRSLRFYPTDSA